MSASSPVLSSTRRPAMTDVGRLAGVSAQTVSRVINDRPGVHPATRERVLLAVRQLGFRPNSTARALVTGRSGVLGIACFDPTLYGRRRPCAESSAPPMRPAIS